MFYSNFSSFFADCQSKAAETFSRIKDKTTFKRLVFACYLIGNADGDFDSDEKTAVANLIQQKMPQYNTSDIRGVIEEADKSIAFDATLGKMELLDEVGKATGDAASSIVRAAVFVAGADGDFDDNEKKVVRELCNRLSLDPANYGL